MRHAGGILGAGSVLIVGIDLEKAPDILYRAYNDAEGVTAKFNLNLLVRINRELGGNFDLAAFEHHAFYNAERHRIEMHLASTKRQRVRIGDATIEFRAGETIHTENSYKFSIEVFSSAGARQRLVAAESVDRRFVQRSRTAHDARLRFVLCNVAPEDAAAAAEDPCGGAVRRSLSLRFRTTSRRPRRCSRHYACGGEHAR